MFQVPCVPVRGNHMRKIIQQILWVILLVGYLITLQTFDYYNNSVPRMFLFFDWQCLRLYPGIAYNLWLNLFVTTGILLLLLAPVILPAFYKVKGRVVWLKVLFWNYVAITVYCTVDIIGCVFFVPGQYHFPIISIILDCVVIALSTWSTRNTGDGGTQGTVPCVR